MNKALFIINPKSGVDRVKALKEDIKNTLNKQLFDYEIVYTEYPKHGTLLAKEGIKKGFNIIVAVGGDGSVNDIVNGIYGSDIRLGIIPKGSGNGLARSLKIPMNQKEAIHLLNRLKIKEIDVGSANDQLFVSNAGVGFDAVVTQKFSKSKRRGFLSYIAIIVKNIWTYKVRKWEVEVDGQKLSLKSFMLTAAIATQLGYGFKIAPEAQLDDGYFDFVNIRKFPTLYAALIAIYAFTGRINKSHFVQTKKVKKLSIQHPKLDYFQIDGEAIKCDKNTVSIKIMEQKLKVLI